MTTAKGTLMAKVFLSMATADGVVLAGEGGQQRTRQAEQNLPMDTHNAVRLVGRSPSTLKSCCGTV